MTQFVRRIPEGDDRERLVCSICDYVAYENPKVIVGSVVVHEERVLLCRRAIEPRRGFWTLPAGYLEHGETIDQGAMREAREEAQAEIIIDGLLAVFSISRIGQVQTIFRARLVVAEGSPAFAAGPESLDVRLFAWEEIPWAEIAFPSVEWSLKAWRGVGSGPLGAPAQNPPGDPRGTSVAGYPEGSL